MACHDRCFCNDVEVRRTIDENDVECFLVKIGEPFCESPMHSDIVALYLRHAGAAQLGGKFQVHIDQTEMRWNQREAAFIT